MEFLKLIEALAANITPGNIGDCVSLVEKLVALAEKIYTDAE